MQNLDGKFLRNTNSISQHNVWIWFYSLNLGFHYHLKIESHQCKCQRVEIDSFHFFAMKWRKWPFLLSYFYTILLWMKHKYLRLAGWTTLGDWELGDAQLAWVGHGDVLEEGGAAGSSLVSLGDLQSYSVKLCSCLIVRPISRAETHWNNWRYMKCHQVMVRFTLKIYLIIVLLLKALN